MARLTLERNVKFKSLVKRLRLPRPYVRGLLETMWDCAHECGKPVLGTSEEVEDSAEWPGKKGVLFEALRDGRWIDQSGDGQWQIHDYWDHAPEYVKDRQRAEERRRAKSPKADRSCGGSQAQNGGKLDDSINKDLRAESPEKSGTSPERSDTPARRSQDAETGRQGRMGRSV
jgi:hypothetical protein